MTQPPDGTLAPAAAVHLQHPLPDSLPFAISTRVLVLELAIVMMLQSLAIDSMLPALPAIARELGAPGINDQQLVISIYVMANGAGALWPGALSDRFGRRPVLLGCLISFALLCLGCALVGGFTALLVMRALAGVAAAGLMVMPAVIIRDRVEGDRMARLQSLVGMVFMGAPIVAPAIGQAVLLVAGWRWIFGVMALMGAAVAGWTALRMPETLPPGLRQPLAPRRLIATLGQVLTCRAAVGYIVATALIQGSMLGWIAGSQQLLGEHFGVGRAFPVYFAGMALSIAATSFVNAQIVERFGARRVCHAAILIYIASSAVQLTMAVAGVETLTRFVAVMTINVGLMGFLGANFGAIALQPFARSAGAAASVQAVVRSGLGATVGIAIGRAYDGSARPLAGAMVMAGCAALLLVLYSERGRLFRRIYPRGVPRPVA